MEAFQDVDDTLLDFGFNQDASCFACGTSSGFRIFSCEPFKRLVLRGLRDNVTPCCVVSPRLRDGRHRSGPNAVSMQYPCTLGWGCDSSVSAYERTNTSFVTHSHTLTRQVMIWDDDQRKCIAELSFRSQVCGCPSRAVILMGCDGRLKVRSVRLRRDRIVVCQESKVSVYNFADLHLLHTIETGPNSRGHAFWPMHASPLFPQVSSPCRVTRMPPSWPVPVCSPEK